MHRKIRAAAATAPAAHQRHRTEHNPGWLFAVQPKRAGPLRRACQATSLLRHLTTFFLLLMNRTFRLLTLAAALPLALSACNTGTKAGDTNVELGSAKAIEPNNEPSRTSSDNGDASNVTANNADSLTAGISRDTTHRPTGRQQFDNAAKSRDKNHDGLAD